MRIEIEAIEMTKSMPPAVQQADYAVEVAELRRRLDAIDDEIMELLLNRIELSTRVMEIKPASQTVDSSREQIIINRYFTKLSDASTMPKVKRLVLGIIGASKIYPD